MPDTLSPAAVMHLWFEHVWNRGRAEAIDERLAPNALVHGLADSTGQEVRGPAGFRQFYQAFRGAFPDIHCAIEDTLESADTVAVRCVVRGTHTGETLGFAATQRRVSFTGMVFAKVKNGQITEAWNNFDFVSFHKQLGISPP